MPISVTLLIGLVIATCIIAYVADTIGKKLGKQRISLLGLRPRQTATIIVMAYSVLIMLVTLGTLLLVDRGLREALLRYDRVKADNQKLDRENKGLQANISLLGSNLKGYQDEADKSQRRARKARSQLQRVREELSSAQSAQKAAQQGERLARQSENSARQAELGARHGETAAKQRASSAQQRASVAQGRFARAQAQFARASFQLLGVNQKLSDVNQKLTREQEKLKLAQERFKNTTRRIESTTKRFVEGVRKQVTTLQADVNQLAEKREALTKQVNFWSQQSNLYEQIANPLKEGRVTVALGQVIVDRTVPAHLDMAQAQAALNALLTEGNQIVTRIGASSLELAPAVLESGSSHVQFGQKEILAALASYLTTFDVPVSVRIVAARYHGEGEKVIQCRMITVPVRTVFARGETIASASIDGSQGDARIFNQLLALVNSGEQAARARGMTPLPTPDNPNFYANSTNERIFEALHRIQTIGGTVNVRLVAAEMSPPWKL